MLWSDIATWVGPTVNQGDGDGQAESSDGMYEYRGLVLHIMQGSYEGSINWGKNPASSVSFHFATAKDGRCGQLVDTAIRAWTQGSGNGRWISVENEGYSGEALTPQQVEACARLYARGVKEYGWPLASTDSPDGRGLGWHGMGGTAWGGHPDCPGVPIRNQRPEILARAQQILNGGSDMAQYWFARDNATGQLYKCDGMNSQAIKQTEMADIAQLAKEGLFTLVQRTGAGWTTIGGFQVRAGWYAGAFGAVPASGGGTGGTVDYARIKADTRDAVADGLEGGATKVRNPEA
jgi:hypothetical protein